MPPLNRKKDTSVQRSSPLKRDREDIEVASERPPKQIRPLLIKQESLSNDVDVLLNDSGSSDTRTISNEVEEQSQDDKNKRATLPTNPNVSSLGSSPPSPFINTESQGARSKPQTFADVLGKAKLPYRPSIAGSILLEDTDVFRVRDLPTTCAVTQPELQDDFLKTGYEGLPPLNAGSFLPWSKTGKSGPGQIMFSPYWCSVIPDMDIWRCLDAIQFARSGRFINPSRVSPLAVNAKRTNLDGSKFRLNIDSSFAICVTSICVTDSFLHRLPSTGLPQKQIRGIVHSQEWDRMVAFFCMVFNEESLHAQLHLDALTFSTKVQTEIEKTGKALKTRLLILPDQILLETHITKGQGLYMQSPSTRRSDTDHPSSTDAFLKNWSDEVPIYDARTVPFDINTDLSMLENKLPLFKEEIPRDSFVVVGYSAAKWLDKSRKPQFSANLQWAIILGTPV